MENNQNRPNQGQDKFGHGKQGQDKHGHGQQGQDKFGHGQKTSSDQKNHPGQSQKDKC